MALFGEFCQHGIEAHGSEAENIRQYAKYLPKEDCVLDKRELLTSPRSRLNYKDKKITLIFIKIQKPSVALQNAIRGRALSPKGQETKFPNRNQISKNPRTFLLARTNEDPLVVRIPDIGRTEPDAAEPEPRNTVLHAEHAQIAIRISNGFHSDENPLAVRLVLVL